MKYFLSFSALWILVLFAAAFAYGQPKPSPSPTPSPTPVKIERITKFDGNVDFPKVSGWNLTPKHVYPTPELGYSVNYESPEGGRVTVYVYNGGQKNIPNTLTGVVADEMNRAKSDIQAAVNAGIYENAKVLRSETINFGGPNGRVKSLYASYDLSARGNQLHSEIYLFPYQNYFVKIRATRPKSLATSEAVADLLTELDVLFLR
ncbi:MAG TPA: hypothetical protein VJ781_11950 [Pyrinomonadaceae bacterium]|nr:hypothetical protein [Pyrinomonadaceae bacterium]